MDESSLEERLTEIQDLLELCSENDAESRPAEFDALLQEALEHVRNARELPVRRKPSDGAADTPAGRYGSESDAEAVDAWISATDDSIVSLAAWR